MKIWQKGSMAVGLLGWLILGWVFVIVPNFRKAVDTQMSTTIADHDLAFMSRLADEANDSELQRIVSNVAASRDEKDYLTKISLAKDYFSNNYKLVPKSYQ